MCITDRNDMTLAVKVALNPNTTNQPICTILKFCCLVKGQKLLNPLPDDKILGSPKLKALADDKSNITQNIKVMFHRIENIVGKEENAG